MKLIHILLASTLLLACEDAKEAKKEVEKETVNEVVAGKKQGLHIAKNHEGVVMNEQRYKDGVLHGESVDNYNDGKRRAQIQYSNGKKNGEALWFFKDGKQIHRLNTYKDDILHGKQEKYYEDGTPLSKTAFYDGYPGVGLREWKTNGNELVKKSELVTKRVGNMLKTSMSSNGSGVSYYYGELTEGQFLNDDCRDITGMDNAGQLLKSEIKDLNKITITSRSRTYLKNNRMTTKTFKWSEL